MLNWIEEWFFNQLTDDRMFVHSSENSLNSHLELWFAVCPNEQTMNEHCIICYITCSLTLIWMHLNIVTLVHSTNCWDFAITSEKCLRWGYILLQMCGPQREQGGCPMHNLSKVRTFDCIVVESSFSRTIVKKFCIQNFDYAATKCMMWVHS